MKLMPMWSPPAGVASSADGYLVRTTTGIWKIRRQSDIP